MKNYRMSVYGILSNVQYLLSGEPLGWVLGPLVIMLIIIIIIIIIITLHHYCIELPDHWVELGARYNGSNERSLQPQYNWG